VKCRPDFRAINRLRKWRPESDTDQTTQDKTGRRTSLGSTTGFHPVPKGDSDYFSNVIFRIA
jgi:hypothetical protein